MTKAERGLLAWIAADMPGTHAHEHLERQSEALARVMRRSPEAVRRALRAQIEYGEQRDALLDAVRRLKPSLEFIGSMFAEAVRTPPPPRK